MQSATSVDNKLAPRPSETTPLASSKSAFAGLFIRNSYLPTCSLVIFPRADGLLTSSRIVQAAEYTAVAVIRRLRVVIMPVGEVKHGDAKLEFYPFELCPFDLEGRHEFKEATPDHRLRFSNEV
ncbi:hypothetical protein M413DRAFT_81981 [Hebeloma cylindrosporum]|uniref:Uncharacterized protein n=1 Tax=Hebeloma cylindrosporum TaxID=76867 RepID=A0A0C2YFX4_HEBCY|nr:hypothetical protein M413DRAFT_81981 [Hebeloma cylindrosporum h7]